MKYLQRVERRQRRQTGVRYFADQVPGQIPVQRTRMLFRDMAETIWLIAICQHSNQRLFTLLHARVRGDVH